MKFFILAVMLNIHTGYIDKQTVVSGPYDQEQQCAKALLDTSVAPVIQKPDSNQYITVYNCVQVDDQV